jgi:hypothetical protein
MNAAGTGRTRGSARTCAATSRRRVARARRRARESRASTHLDLGTSQFGLPAQLALPAHVQLAFAAQDAFAPQALGSISQIGTPSSASAGTSGAGPETNVVDGLAPSCGTVASGIVGATVTTGDVNARQPASRPAQAAEVRREVLITRSDTRAWPGLAAGFTMCVQRRAAPRRQRIPPFAQVSRGQRYLEELDWGPKGRFSLGSPQRPSRPSHA